MMASTRDTQHETSDEAVEIKTPDVSRPAKSKYRDQFTETETFKRVTFHEVSRLTEQTLTQILDFIFKKNDPGSHSSELEAAYAEFYRFLAPDYIAETFAVEDKATGKYIGVVSEKFPEFKSTVHDPLNEDDLQVDFITTKNLSFDLLDALHDEYTELKKQTMQLEKKLKKVNELAAFHDAQLKKQRNNPNALSEAERKSLAFETEANLLEKIKLVREDFLVAEKLRNFNNKLTETHKITEREFEKYRIIKGTAIALTTSYIYDEDDMHRNNWTKYGVRIDFDMSGWPISYHYKKEALDRYYSNIFESTLLDLRQPTADAFRATAKDLYNFPCLEDAQPSYWPTNQAGAVTSSVQAIINKLFPVSTNPYPTTTNALYKKLKNNPVFRYHYFFTLAKFILCNESIYKQLALMHIREDSEYKPEGKLLYGKIIELTLEKMNAFRDLLVKMPEFCEFFKANHEKIIMQLVKNIKQAGIAIPKDTLTATCAEVLAAVSTPRAKPASTPATPVAARVEVKTVPLTPAEAFAKLETTIKAKMGEYTGTTFGKFFRNHYEFAAKLAKECESLKPGAKDMQANIVAIEKLKNIITTELNRTQVTPPSTTPVKAHLKGQGMYDALDALLKQIDELKLAPNQSLTSPVATRPSPARSAVH